jgi:UDP-N-acetylmuramate--alanine ligase
MLKIPPRYHIAGIAGVGMSALAQTMTAHGLHVTGSDRYIDQGCDDLPVLRCLKASGITFYPQDGSAITADLSGIAISTAVEESNPEIQQARKLGIPVIHRAAMLAEMIGSDPLITIAGTSGKTTVTGMTGWLLEQAGLDPFVVNGGAVPAWRSPSATGSVRPSTKPLWVIEADESDRSFLRFHPRHTIITNISQDHFGLEESIQLFQRFAAQVRERIICSPAVAELLSDTPDNRKTIIDPSCVQRDDSGWYFTHAERAYRVPQPGRHNALNALAAFTLCRILGCSAESLHRALATFPGIERRLECCGRNETCTVYDDYAHNPEKIRAAWTTIKEIHPRVIGIWKPHGFRPLAAMADALSDTFQAIVTGEDRLYVPPVYYAGGTTARSITSESFCRQLKARGIPAQAVANYETLMQIIPQEAHPGTAILCMGARDPELPLFAHRLTTRRHP